MKKVYQTTFKKSNLPNPQKQGFCGFGYSK